MKRNQMVKGIGLAAVILLVGASVTMQQSPETLLLKDFRPVSLYRITFRILESEDEHFYEHGQFGYHWALNGLGLPEEVLRKVYRENALKILRPHQ